MAYSRLALFNEALRICGERKLASLTEDRKPRHLLDDVWSAGGVDDVLEEGQWNFAMRAVQLDYDPAVDPQFGFSYAFSKPSDWIRTAALCTDEAYSAPLLRYVDEADYWYADPTPLYIKYVSNDTNYGADLSRWPGSFSSYAAAHFASKIVLDLTSDKERVQLVHALAKQERKNALNKDAMNQPPAQPAATSWVQARAGGVSRRDRGSRGNLIG